MTTVPTPDVDPGPAFDPAHPDWCPQDSGCVLPTGHDGDCDLTAALDLACGHRQAVADVCDRLAAIAATNSSQVVAVAAEVIVGEVRTALGADRDH